MEHPGKGESGNPDTDSNTYYSNAFKNLHSTFVNINKVFLIMCSINIYKHRNNNDVWFRSGKRFV